MLFSSTRRVAIRAAARSLGRRQPAIACTPSLNFSTEGEADEVALAEKAANNAMRIEQNHFVRDSTVTPWTARTISPVAQESNATDGQLAQLAGIPNAIKERTVTIYRPARAASTTGRQNTKAWKLEFGNKPRWVNHLMGYYSSGDPVGQFSMRFETSADAAAFCDKMGYNYVIKEFNEAGNFHGKKSYSWNFLAEQVGNDMKSNGRRYGQKWFSHKAGKQSAWVNVERSDYGSSEPYKKDGNKDVAKAAPIPATGKGDRTQSNIPTSF